MALAAAGLAVEQGGTALAETPFLDGTVSGSVTAVSNYISRGFSNSDDHPALQGILDYTHASGLYLGTFASNVDFDDNNNATVEWDVWGGYGFTWRGIALRADALWYYYPGVGRGMASKFNTLEFDAGAEFAYSGATVGVGLAYSPNYFFNSGDSFYYDMDVSVPLFGAFALEGHVGHQDVRDNATFGTPDYNDWSLGVSVPWRGFKLGLYYTDTDLARDECFAGKDWCQARAVATLGYTF
jgi:uncharacterized protein (TIGR02001 family)